MGRAKTNAPRNLFGGLEASEDGLWDQFHPTQGVKAMKNINPNKIGVFIWRAALEQQRRQTFEESK